MADVSPMMGASTVGASTVGAPTILALDFDGVVCDGLIEYFQTAWRAYCQIWQPAETTPPEGIAESFYRLRPVVETGWEMPLVVRSLLLGTPEAEILAHWGAIAQSQLAADGVNPNALSIAVDGTRDQWIAADLPHWLDQHRFYPGVVERLQQVIESAIYPLIITTKEGRFVRQLLQRAGVTLPDAQIIGKEIKQPKSQTLRDLLQQVQQETGKTARIWFVEDRLKTLLTVQSQPDLSTVTLFLADWGYNTAAERQQAQALGDIRLLSLDTFAQPFADWVGR